ncbi:unnamed protein product, partial [Polarella glacialis]
ADNNLQAQENSIRRAYRNIARRYKRNIFNDPAKFEFQMRILNLAKEALVKGEQMGSDGWNSDEDEEDENVPRGPGRELSSGSRASDEILKQIHSWQEFALEEGVRFDDPEVPFFIGHTQHGYRDAFESNWSHFVPQDLADLWPAASGLQYQAELDGSAGGTARAHSVRLSETARQLARDALAAVAGALHSCGGRDPTLAGPIPESGDSAAWVDLQLKASRNLRVLFAGFTSIPGVGSPCALAADREARAALLELNLEALEQLGAPGDGDGRGRADVAQEIRAAHAAATAARTAATPLLCQESANIKRAALERLWEEYHFGPLVDEAYPSDACGLEGLSSFLEFHIGRGGELLERRAEPDRTVLRALRGLLALQQALSRPAGLSSGATGSGLASEKGAAESDVGGGIGYGWRGAVSDVEEAIWRGIAFPELHEAVGKLMAELANAGLMPEVLAAMLEHPPVKGGLEGGTLPHGREPADVQPAKEPRFMGLDVPGYNMKPMQRYEEKALHLWGNDEDEERWDPVRMGLSYIDLTPACDLPIQVAMCFMSAALWMWRALQLLGDKCGGDGWLDNYIFEDIWSAPPESKRLAMQFSLKKAAMEFVDYAASLADHQLLPGARLTIQRTGYLLLRQVTARFGAAEDAPRVLEQLRRLLAADRLNPLWSPPVLPVADAVFVDILSGRLHASFLEKLHQTGAPGVLPSALPEYTFYEASLLGSGDAVDVTYARFEVMGALLRDTGRSWAKLEAALVASPLGPQDAAGFTLDRQDATGYGGDSQRQSLGFEAVPEFAAVRGIRIDMSTGKATLLLARPAATAPPLLSLVDAASILGLEDTEPLMLALDRPAEKGAGAAQYTHHPFQSAELSPGAGVDRHTESALLYAALTVQQIASGNEVAIRAPFPLRPCSQGFCKGLPPKSREHLQPLAYLRGEPWDVAQRLVLECSKVPYWQLGDGQVLEIRFGEPVLEVHAGKPLRALNEEEFKTWSVAKLRQAVRQVQKELGSRGVDDEGDLPPLEKHELVESLLRASERGVLLEDEEESGDPLSRYARRLNHHMPAITQRWPHMARLAPFCALRAAGLVLRLQLQQFKDNAVMQQQAMKTASKEHAQGMKMQQQDAWRGALAEVHARALRELGFVDLDTGGCFLEGSGRSFGHCCSVGDHASECWSQGQAEERGEWSELQQAETAREEELRCCGSSSRRVAFSPPVVAGVAAQLGSASPRKPRPQDLIPVVDAWLRNPTGLAASEGGETLSAAVVSLLAEEISEETIVDQQARHLQEPLEKLTADLSSLGPSSPAVLEDIKLGKEPWVPLPTLVNSGGRRAIYSTVALSPQLLGLEGADVDIAEAKAAALYGPIEELSLDELMGAVGRQRFEARTSGAEKSPGFRALKDATALLQSLDQRTEALDAGGLTQEEKQGTAELELASCGADGWAELDGIEALLNLTSGERLRLRHRASEDVNGEEATVEAVLTLVGEPGTTTQVWELLMAEDGSRRYLDVTDSALAVATRCQGSATEGSGSLESPTAAQGGNTTASHDYTDLDFIPLPAETVRPTGWPGCIEPGVATPSLDGSGLFVNLEALGIKEGCFKNDCSYSDHFTSASPADCARTCAKIRACGRWTFWEGAPATCWLRSRGPKRHIEASGAVSGSSSCLPPQDVKPEVEPTLFKLVAGPAGTPPPSLWEELDLVGVLEEFGHLTVAEVRRAQPSLRQRSALRMASVASSVAR